MARVMAKRRATRPARRVGAALALAVAMTCTAAGMAARARAAGTADATDAGCGAAWPRWDAFKRDFISADGRVIDVGSADSRTVSEGQAYGLFFALVANDRRMFDTILAWTENNLAQGDLSAHL
ncbi:TPA: cellulase, partial [Burkholderia cepacia ATCC 25416]|nr:cellulase [Burkholderia cepacia ATCC 25416]